MADSLPTGGLTPRTAAVIAERRYCGDFAQPDGFAGVLDVDIRQNGSAYLTLHYRGANDKAKFWSIGLTSEQRKNLAEFLVSAREPVLWEDVTRMPNPFDSEEEPKETQ